MSGKKMAQQRKNRGVYKQYASNSDEFCVPKSTRNYHKRINNAKTNQELSDDVDDASYYSNGLFDGNELNGAGHLTHDLLSSTEQIASYLETVERFIDPIVDEDEVIYTTTSPGNSNLPNDRETTFRIGKEEEEKLYPGCLLNLTEAVILVFSFAIRFKLPNTGIEDLLKLINLFLPEGTVLPQSVYLLEKLLNADYSSATRHYYCKQCDSLLQGNTKLCSTCVVQPCQLCNATLPGDTTLCATCGTRNRKSVKKNFFVTFDIKKSLEHVLRRPSVQQCLLKNFKRRELMQNTIRDIIDGEQYQRLQLKGHDISCCLNTDGASIFNSTVFSIWPLLFSINELDYPLRRKHTFLGGLWWGTGKPNFNLLLEPVVKCAQELNVRKIRWTFLPNPQEGKVVFPLFATDAVAKCKLQGMTQFNGEYGCPWCIIKGEALKDEGNNFIKWIYDPTLKCAGRTNEGFRSNVRELCELLQKGRMEKESVFGITGASRLLLFPTLDVVKGNLFDYMHTGLLGILKTLTTGFFDSSNHEKPYYLGRQKEQIDKRISLCKFPSECSRLLRPVKDINQWKASEWKLWMMLSTSILEGVLSHAYLNHLAMLTNSLSMLLQEEITPTDLRISADLIDSFCNLIPALYGKENYLFNFHILRHAVDCVKHWGPLWCYSLFQFQQYNNILVNSYSGTSKVGEQIVHRTIRSQEVYSQSECIFENEHAKAFCYSLVERKKMFVKAKKLTDCTLLGAAKPYHFSVNEEKLLSTALILTEGIAYAYNSCLVKGKVFRTKHKGSETGCDYIILSSGKFYEVENILFVEGHDFGVIFVRRILVVADNYGLDKFKFKVTSIASSPLKILAPHSIDRCKVTCIINEEHRIVYICPLINNIELE